MLLSFDDTVKNNRNKMFLLKLGDIWEIVDNKMFLLKLAIRCSCYGSMMLLV